MAKHFPNNKSNQFLGKYIVMVQFKSANRTQRKDLNRTTTTPLPKKSRHFGLNLTDIPDLRTRLPLFSSLSTKLMIVKCYTSLCRKPGKVFMYLLQNKTKFDITFVHKIHKLKCGVGNLLLVHFKMR